MMVIQKVSRDQSGNVIAVMWRPVEELKPLLRYGHAVEAPIAEVVDAIVVGKKVHVLLSDGMPGPIVETATSIGGFTTIADKVAAHAGQRLADLPTF